MFSQVAKLFLLHKWFAIILETSQQLVGLESVLALLFFSFFLPLGKSKHHKIASISSCGMVSVLAIAEHTAVVRIPAATIFSKFYF